MEEVVKAKDLSASPRNTKLKSGWNSKIAEYRSYTVENTEKCSGKGLDMR
jgi:hypothetical protein